MLRLHLQLDKGSSDMAPLNGCVSSVDISTDKSMVEYDSEAMQMVDSYTQVFKLGSL